MSRLLEVAFLWHMHQPLYLDPKEGQFSMPWVRLHSVKAYTDMAACLENQEQAHATFNLVPSLLYQIEAYQQGKTDDFLEVSRRPASDLTPADQDFLLTHFFSCHWPTMVEPYPRYAQLLGLRGRKFDPSNASRIRTEFSAKDFLDLQVWFNLTWVGFASRGDTLIRSLLQKGRLFSEDEKEALLDFHLQCLKEVIPRYASLWRSGQIELTTTPFYHPILPLLIDTDVARRARPETPIPPRFQHKDDVRLQLDKARNFFSRVFGRSPEGLWPSEGSVSPELIPLVQEAGFSWAATDDAILYHSVDRIERDTLFQPYRVEVEGGAVDMVFRHHELSDLIGFVYQKNDPEVAVSDFLGRLREIGRACEGMRRPPLVVVILDGENPWEYYPNGGEAFLFKLYYKLLQEPGIELTTIGASLERHPPQRTLLRLHSGSWINNDYGIWIGGPEENRAWASLGEARTELERSVRGGLVESETLERAREAILVAEGSDWFWWYGDKFSSDYQYEFDRLFRLYLQEVYAVLGRKIPEDLLSPIRKPRPVSPTREPVGFIHPQIDGRLSHYLEWTGAGALFLMDRGGAMHQGEGSFREIVYGFDLDWFYLRLDPREKGFKEWEKGIEFRVTLTGRCIIVLELEPKGGEATAGWVIRLLKDGEEMLPSVAGLQWAVEEVAEIGMPFALLGLGEDEELTFCVETVRSGIVQDRWPHEGYIVVRAPDEDYERRIWLV